jgi:hypothetical protein
MIPRPRFRLPVWAAVAIVAAAYVLRSVVLRGGDFRPDLPADAVVAVVLVVALPLVVWARMSTPPDPDDTSVGPADDETGRAD